MEPGVVRINTEKDLKHSDTSVSTHSSTSEFTIQETPEQQQLEDHGATSVTCGWKPILAILVVFTTLFVLALGFVLVFEPVQKGPQPLGQEQAYLLPFLLAMIVICWAFSLLFVVISNKRRQKWLRHEYKVEDVKGCSSYVPVYIMHKPDIGAQLIFVSAMALSAQLIIRLLCAPHFDGQIAYIDFGLKCGESENSTRFAPACIKRNHAFDPEFNSFGHFIQGFMSLLLFPALDVTFSCITNSLCSMRAPPACQANLREIIGCLVVVYPCYNIMKRSILHGRDFASSSFCNNGFEWAYGFTLGISLGVTFSTITGYIYAAHLSITNEEEAKAQTEEQRKSLRSARATLRISLGEDKHHDHHAETMSHATCSSSGIKKCVKISRIIAGSTLCIATFVAGIMVGVTWDNVASGGAEDHLDMLATTVLCLVSVGMLVALCWWAVHEQRKRALRELTGKAIPSIGIEEEEMYSSASFHKRT